MSRSPSEYRRALRYALVIALADCARVPIVFDSLLMMFDLSARRAMLQMILDHSFQSVLLVARQEVSACEDALDATD